MSETHYVVKFAGKASGQEPWGQKDAWPLSHAQLAYGNREYAGTHDRKGHTEMDTSYFTILDMDLTNFDQNVVQSLRSYLISLTTTQMKPDTITISEITTSDDSANYKVNRSVEHTEALIGGNPYSRIQIVSDTATLSTIPEGGTDATEKTELDFKNRRINGK